MTPLIAPSILSADFADLKGQIALAEQGGADWIHLDVMDGHFVPNITIGPPVVASLRKLTRLPFDTHLMIEDPDRYLEEFRSAGADLITVHVEACRHLHRTVARIKELGARAGVSLNPATPVELLTDILSDVDLVLNMTVNPGFGGQKFIPESIDKLHRLSTLAAARHPGIYVEVDGGIDTTTAAKVVSAGANVLVAGTFVFRSDDVGARIAQLRSVSAI